MKKIALVLVLGLVLSLLILPFNSIAAKRKAQKRVGIMAETNTGSVATNLGLYGAYIWDIAVDASNNNYIYAAIGYSPNGIYRSADAGQTWTGLPNTVDYGSGSHVEVNPSNGTVFAIAGNSLLKSTNHGSSFSEIKNANSNAITYANSKLFVGTGDGALKVSTNDGSSFTTKTIASGSPIQSLAVYGNTVYAHNYANRLFRSTDGGSNWSELTGLPLSSINRVVVNPNTGTVFILPPTWGGTTYRSSNGGSSWTALAADTQTSGNITFDSSGRAYNGWQYSDTEGDSWHSFGRGGNYVHHIFPDPTNVNILYDTSSPGFSKSADRGTTWTSSVTGMLGVVVSSVSQASDKNIVWAATQNGLAKTTNYLSGSPTWQYPIFSSSQGYAYISSGHDSVWVHPTNPDIVITGGSNDLLRSTNGGASWSQPTTPLSFIENIAFQITASGDDAAGIYAAVGKNGGSTTNVGGVIKSTDNGANWMSMSFPVRSAQSIAIARNGDIFAGAGSKAKDETDKGIYKYSNNSWSKTSAPNYDFRAIVADPESADTIYALASGSSYSANYGFYKSADGGSTWEHITVDSNRQLDQFNTLAIQRSTSPNSLYLSAIDDQSGVVYKSSDGGQTWGLYYKGLKSESFNALLFDGLIAGNDRGLYSIKSRASIVVKAKPGTVKKGKVAKLIITMKDAATKKKLKNRKVDLYKKVGKKWKRVRKGLRLNKKGQAAVNTRLGKTTIFQARWKPANKNDKEEYATSKSKNAKVKVKKK